MPMHDLAKLPSRRGRITKLVIAFLSVWSDEWLMRNVNIVYNKKHVFRFDGVYCVFFINRAISNLILRLYLNLGIN